MIGFCLNKPLQTFIFQTLTELFQIVRDTFWIEKSTALSLQRTEIIGVKKIYNILFFNFFYKKCWK